MDTRTGNMSLEEAIDLMAVLGKQRDRMAPEAKEMPTTETDDTYVNTKERAQPTAVDNATN